MLNSHAVTGSIPLAKELSFVSPKLPDTPRNSSSPPGPDSRKSGILEVPTEGWSAQLGIGAGLDILHAPPRFRQFSFTDRLRKCRFVRYLG